MEMTVMLSPEEWAAVSYYLNERYKTSPSIIEKKEIEMLNTKICDQSGLPESFYIKQ